MTMFFLAVIAVAIAYFFILCWLAARTLNSSSLTDNRPITSNNSPTVSVIIAARNEAENLPALIECLKTQNFPPEKIEFCIVDDRSEDASRQILKMAQSDFPRLKIVEIDDTLPNFATKKRALTEGVEATSGEILLFTDADCLPPPNWAKTMAGRFDANTAVVLGYSPYFFRKAVPSWLSGILSLDMFSLGAISAAGALLGKPATATGCNFSYTREAYKRVDGFERIKHWVSGDDDLMLHNIMASETGKCRFALERESFVPQRGPESFRQFWRQRLRWASKGLDYPLPVTLSLAAVYLLNLSVALLPFWIFLELASLTNLTLACLALKASGEFIFLAASARIFGEEHLLKYFPLTAAIHPLYVSVFAVLGVVLQFSWKDDKAPKTRPEPSVNA